MLQLFDIFCDDKEKKECTRKAIRHQNGRDGDRFFENMRTNRSQYFKAAVDRRWKKTMERKTKQEKALEKIREKYEESNSKEYASTFVITELEYCQMDDYVTEFFARKKGKKLPCSQCFTNDNPLPICYQHIRKSENAPFYRTVDALTTK